MNITYSYYRFITSLFFIPLLPLILLLRFLSGKKTRHFLQRFAFYDFRQPSQNIRRIWIHASSVGETSAACSIIDEIIKITPDTSILLSTVTKTGLDAAERLTDKRIVKILAPLDFEFTVSRAFDFFRPDVLVITETELWPNMIMIASKKNIKVITANGRISESSRRVYKKLQPVSSEVLSSINAFSMISESDCERIKDIGADPARVFINGNSKYDQAMKLKNSAVEKTKSDNLNLLIKKNNRKLIVAGSTRPGEEKILIDAFINLQKSIPESILAIAPRHIKRTNKIEKIMQKSSIGYSLRTDLPNENHGETNVIIINTIGELASLYRLADAVFCGGSLLPYGGQNPIEAAVLGKPLLFGPFMDDFKDVAEILKNSDSAKEIKNAEELCSSLVSILGDLKISDEIGKKTAVIIEEMAGAAKRHAKVILKYS